MQMVKIFTCIIDIEIKYCFAIGLKVTKCYKYWPNARTESQIGPINIKTSSEERVTGMAGLTKRYFKVQLGKDNETKQVIQYHYTDWPDFGVPVSPQPLVEMTKMMRGELSTKGGVGLVHCSAGVGRTGTMLALNKIMEDIDGGAEDIDIFNTVLNLRSERVFMVQKLVQYEFLHACTDYYLRTKSAGKSHAVDIASSYGHCISIDEEKEIDY